MLYFNEGLAKPTCEGPDVNVLMENPFVIFYASGTKGVSRRALYTHGLKLDNTICMAHSIIFMLNWDINS